MVDLSFLSIIFDYYSDPKVKINKLKCSKHVSNLLDENLNQIDVQSLNPISIHILLITNC